MSNTTNLFQIERRSKILNLLHLNGKIFVSDLQKRFDVSGATIRTDLNEMEQEGLLIRTHGGAVEFQRTREDDSLEERSKKRIIQKRAIAKTALTMISAGDTIIVDGGTTIGQFVECLAENPIKKLTVMTNYSPHLSHLSECPDVTTIFIGGEYNKDLKAMMGFPAIEMIKDFKVDKVFLSATGLSLEQGITFTDIGDAMVKQAMLDQGKTIIMLTDSSKIGKSNFVSAGGLDKIDILVTDWEIADKTLSEIREIGIKVVVVPEPEDKDLLC